MAGKLYENENHFDKTQLKKNKNQQNCDYTFGWMKIKCDI